MSTIIDDAGNYPIEDIKVWPSFDTLWKDDISCIPEAPLDYDEREKFKVFAQKVYERLTCGDFIQSVANVAYEDGYEDGKKNAKEDIIDAINNI